MTGTGAQADPFVVSTWNDLRTAMLTIKANGTYIELDADIDMNEVAPQGISRIETRGIILDGKNHTIKNLIANSGFLHLNSTNTGIYISNLKILNFINRGTSSFISTLAHTEFYFRHCTISGINESTAKMLAIVSDDERFGLHFTTTTDGGCFLNVNISSGGFAQGIVTITDSYVKLSGESWSDSASWRLNNSYVEGKFSGSGFKNCYNSVIDAECVNSNNFSVNNCSNLLVNTDKFTNNLSNENGIKKVTSEQLINAEYLESIGFPIGVE